MLILLPPSEGKTAPQRGKPLDLATLRFPELDLARSEALDALVELSSDLERAVDVLGLGPRQHDLVRANAALRTAATARAERIYAGVLYEALAPATLSPAARRRLNRVAVASALFGLVGLADRIPAYRLSGDVDLPGVGKIAAHWRPQLGAAVENAVGAGTLIDLRSGTYASFWRPSGDLARRTVSLRVLHEQNGRRSVVSHFNKATKGRIVRDLLEEGGSPRTPAEFATQLRDLGWQVEDTDTSGTRLDVVVSDVHASPAR